MMKNPEVKHRTPERNGVHTQSMDGVATAPNSAKGNSEALEAHQEKETDNEG